MQIQLKQIEIVAALKQYITHQGIDLTGKTVNIVFTAGRKESGIIADLIIEEMAIPGFSDPDKDPVALTLVSDIPLPESAAPQEATPTASVDSDVAIEKPAKSVSLFN